MVFTLGLRHTARSLFMHRRDGKLFGSLSRPQMEWRCRKNLPLSVTVAMISHAEFTSTLIEAFPEMEAEVRDEDGLLHLEMSVFSRFTQNAIDAPDATLLDRYFAFANNLFRNADDAVKNAVYVSYLEHLNCTDGKSKRAWALGHMPPILLAGFHDINEYNARLHGRTPE